MFEPVAAASSTLLSFMKDSPLTGAFRWPYNKMGDDQDGKKRTGLYSTRTVYSLITLT